jgi:hypothetical protein
MAGSGAGSPAPALAPADEEAPVRIRLNRKRLANLGYPAGHVVWSYFPSTEAKSVVIEVDAASFRTMPNEIGIPLPNGGWVLARQVELLDKPPPGQGSA